MPDAAAPTISLPSGGNPDGANLPTRDAARKS
jgi:hypothetical protein